MHTWDDAVSLWLQEKASKASLKSDVANINWLNQYLSGLPLEDITRVVIASLAQRKIGSGVSNATVNRMLAVLRAILLRSVHEWEWLSSAPKIHLLSEPSRRVRYLTRSQAIRLLFELPPHLSDMCAFTLATGLRAANVTGLQWEQVDMTRRLAWIHPDQAKNRKAIPVPLNIDAMRLLTARKGIHQTHVFSYKGKPIRKVSTAAWYKALRRAGITDFRWHDLRHTWASWHVQSGTPMHVLQELGGWESEAMVRRYAHLSASHLTAYADKLPSLMQI
ncbi:site-specific integrase [Herbaspirillum sp. HC18]|nr:site-specific integrase [Herbaspirillum sp. HC18]